MAHSQTNTRSWLTATWAWLTGDQLPAGDSPDADPSIAWLRCLPFFAMHAACLGVIWVGFSWAALVTAVLLYVARMFFVTGFYHRYFSHRTFKTSRVLQFMMGALACTAGQRGPLWWAAHHRRHHNHSDQDPDLHSPRIVGLLRAHVGWFMTKSAFRTDERMVRDWDSYGELRWLNRFDWLPLAVLAIGVWILGVALAAYAPSLGTNGLQMLVWGFFISTVFLYHATYTINSLAHRLGRVRYDTGDDSRNNFWLALLTLGEGWHNNHHHYPAATRQGFFWWEIDITYYGLWLMSRLGLIWNLQPAPAHAVQRNRIDRPTRENRS